MKLVIITPLILTKLGVDGIAFWYLLMTVHSLSMVLDFGLLPTLSRLISYAFGGSNNLRNAGTSSKSEFDEPNWKLIKEVFDNTRILYLFVTVLFLIVLSGIGLFVISDFINKIESGPYNYWLCYNIFSVSLIINFFSKSYEAVLIGVNKVSLNNRWTILLNIINVLLMFIFLIQGFKLVALTSIILLISVFNLLRSYILVKRLNNSYLKSNKKVDGLNREILEVAWSPIWRSAIGILGSTGLLHISSLVYSTMTDAVTLAAYLFSLKMMSAIVQFSKAPFYSKIPIYSMLRARGDLDELGNRTALGVQYSLYTFAILSFVLIGFGNGLLSAIESNTNLLETEILVLMALVFFLERHHGMHAQIYSTTNHIPFYIPIIISGILNIILLVISLPRIGVWAFPISLGLSNLVINNWWNVKISVKSLETSFLKYARKSIVFPTITFVGLLIIAYYFNAQFSIFTYEIFYTIKNII
ncbi:MAG: hypothetical protein JJ966_10500 [Balneolaceae bacterium]|nr:hypothetical protein [Balneolaceae bacterium]